MIKIELKDIIDVLTQMRDDVIELYDGETIYSLSLSVAMDVLKGGQVRPYYLGDIL